MIWIGWYGVGAVVWLLTLGLAAWYGGRAGRRARRRERVRVLRMLHDTVLHALEVLATGTDQDRVDPAGSLRQARGVARGQADRLRRAMTELSDGPAPPLTAALQGVVEEFLPVGLRTRLVAAERLPDLPAQRQAALRDAVRAALGNVVKHAGVDRALIRVEPAAAGVRVVIRDNGRGFDPVGTAPGFGVRQSLVARLREAGGSASLSSRPSGGTRVELWVPR